MNEVPLSTIRYWESQARADRAKGIYNPPASEHEKFYYDYEYYNLKGVTA